MGVSASRFCERSIWPYLSRIAEVAEGRKLYAFRVSGQIKDFTRRVVWSEATMQRLAVFEQIADLSVGHF